MGRSLPRTVRALTVLITATWLAAGVAAGAVRNVIVMVPDGTAPSVAALARWVKGAPLALDEIVVGTVRTCAADSVITDSAAAATAFATGHKTDSGSVSVGPSEEGLIDGPWRSETELRRSPLATVLEGARLMGKATGIVVTCNVSHATPAAFGAHVAGRADADGVMLQLAHQNIDVVLGGGRRNLLPTADGGARKDGRNLLAELQRRGTTVVGTAAELAQATSTPLWGVFAANHMAAALDRGELAPDQPTLPAMTAKALDLLAGRKDGFFLMVEGSQVDWGAHANDPAYTASEFIAFDDAVRIALDFARRDGDTLLIVFPDHGTGGIDIGNRGTDGTYAHLSVEKLVEPLRKMRVTAATLAAKIGRDHSPENIRRNLATWWGIDASSDDIAAILAAAGAGESFDDALARVISERHTVIGWTTHGHMGTDVDLWSFGPGHPTGELDNTDLARVTAQALGFDLAAVQRELFVDARTALPDAIVDTSDPASPRLRIGRCTIVAGTDEVLVGAAGLPVRLDGVAVYTPATGRFWLPRIAVDLIARLSSGPRSLEELGHTSLRRPLTFADFGLRIDRDALRGPGAAPTPAR